MNVIISNKYHDMLSTLDIDVIKSMNGEFEVDELINTFSNFFFNRMLLDVTAIKNYKDISTLQKLSMNLDMSKVILILDDSEECNSGIYLSKLVSMGIYNFSRSIDTIKYLMDNPNAYKDVAHLQNLNETIVYPTATNNSQPIAETQVIMATKIIGFKNLTEHSGATTLIYMLKKQIANKYKTLAIELDKRDFTLFNDPELVSITNNELPATLLKNKDKEVILIDVNNTTDLSFLNELIYLIEPSTLKLNKLIRRNRNIFNEISGNKIVLNQSMLEQSDIADFEYEAKTKLFFNIPPLDDKKESHKVLDGFLVKLGLIRNTNGNKEKKGLFSRF